NNLSRQSNVSQTSFGYMEMTADTSLCRSLAISAIIRNLPKAVRSHRPSRRLQQRPPPPRWHAGRSLRHALSIAMPLAPAASADTPLRHRPYEDAQALFTGTLFVSITMILFAQAGLLTGSTAGIAFLLHYWTGLPF